MPKDPSFNKLFQRIRAKKPKDLDMQFSKAHEEVFKQVECLSCGNCCKTTSPMWNETDIQRVAKHLKMKVADFLDAYLVKDADGDWVYPASPCPFLLEDNACDIYEQRPKACREYPHTDRKNMLGILKLTQTNTLICPAVSQIMEKLERIYH
ncbi:YkgJ family cysteine cluster protein [Aquirufa rosea]|uniref:YkgJ family cysteine cluster protein n=1 Tax=Aquirufa rosea TaxID=2509241 RepID=A0A4Q1BXM5_9BACT|nr:YkgJ family cysteine cluster protein [Aquirufa rosea]RXK47133.1 YkgJ family cysteine cluster protein [Aquirufa rosea]